ncbi:MAG TPA: phosphoribosylglycinamide formyltransferase [Phycisphaerales bacterium]|nr:phosphoribosylglycinamide formyltransferase [Phycisphaerales bacterium]
MSKRLRLGALISGGGRTLLNLMDCIERGTLDAAVAVVISSRADTAGVERIRARGIEVKIAAKKSFADEHAMHDQISVWLHKASVDLVCLCGYLRGFRIDPEFRGKVVNIHPSLLPKFGGKGMYGERVHEAVLRAGETASGCTVHFVDDEYDRGPVILQRQVNVKPGDTVETLAARVFEKECEAYPEAIQMIAEGRVRESNGSVEFRNPHA